jgi:hypothetical protein
VRIKLHVLTALLLGGRVPSIHWIGDWVGSITSLDYVEQVKILPLLGLKILPLDLPANIQPLYHLPYLGS